MLPYLKLENSMFVSVGCKIPMQNMKFACGLTLAKEEMKVRKVGIGTGRRVKMISNQEI